MPQSPAAMYFTLAAILLVSALVTIWIKTRYQGFRPNLWTYVCWTMLAAVFSYTVYLGIRHL